MGTLERSSLTDEERRAVQRLVAGLRSALRDELRAVWLYGSRARGEPRRAGSDVDVMVVTDGGFRRDWKTVGHVAAEAVDMGADEPVLLEVRTADPEYVHGRRAIRSFFFADVDRDKIVLFGDP